MKRRGMMWKRTRHFMSAPRTTNESRNRTNPTGLLVRPEHGTYCLGHVPRRFFCFHAVVALVAQIIKGQIFVPDIRHDDFVVLIDPESL